MPAVALAHADRLAVSAIVLLRRSEKRGERTRALHDTLMEFRQLLMHVRFPVRHRLLELGIRLAVAVAGFAAGMALHVYGVPWAAVAVAAVMIGVLVWLKRRPFPWPPSRIDGEAEGDVEAIVEEIGVALAHAGASRGYHGRFAHLQACYARAWDLVHWGPLPAYTPGEAAEYGGSVYGQIGEYLSPFWTPAACTHVMVHQYWQMSLHDLAARQRLARCDHALRYLSPPPNARAEITARILCALVPLGATAVFGALVGALIATPLAVVVSLAMLDPCQDHPSAKTWYGTFAYENITGDDPFTRLYFAASPDPLLREWLGR